jgi:homoserine kinase type II
MELFVLWHLHEMPGGEEDAKMNGVYSSPGTAEQAKRRTLLLPGFRDAPDGFVIDPYVIDKDHWTEGYITETHDDIVRACREQPS